MNLTTDHTNPFPEEMTMGWYGGYGSKKEIELELTKTGHCDLGTYRTLEFSWQGNCLWMLQEVELKDGRTDGPFITLALVENRSGFSYKPMDESCGPFYYSVPRHYLEKAPVVNPRWRNAVLTGVPL